MTSPKALRSLLLPVAAVCGVVLASVTAHAQIGGQQLSRPQVQQDEKPKNKVLPPPALPGSKQVDPDSVAPSDRAATDMEPNEALFDAVNRGDVAAAKDALGRGADVDSRNVLGLTPLELSVDLGRNDLSFLLLSMRGGGSTRPAAGPAVASRSPATPAPARPSAKEQRQAAVAAVRAAPAAPQRPQLFAGNGGAPVPQAGFLGFNTGRAP